MKKVYKIVITVFAALFILGFVSCSHGTTRISGGFDFDLSYDEDDFEEEVEEKEEDKTEDKKEDKKEDTKDTNKVDDEDTNKDPNPNPNPTPSPDPDPAPKPSEDTSGRALSEYERFKTLAGECKRYTEYNAYFEVAAISDGLLIYRRIKPEYNNEVRLLIYSESEYSLFSGIIPSNEYVYLYPFTKANEKYGVSIDAFNDKWDLISLGGISDIESIGGKGHFRVNYTKDMAYDRENKKLSIGCNLQKPFSDSDIIEEITYIMVTPVVDDPNLRKTLYYPEITQSCNIFEKIPGLEGISAGIEWQFKIKLKDDLQYVWSTSSRFQF